MKFKLEHRGDLRAIIITATENCDTDTRPFVNTAEFRQFDGDFDLSLGCVAASILFSDWCGELMEFQSPIGLDYRSAVKTVVDDATDVFPIDAAKREFADGRDTLLVGEANRLVQNGFSPTQGTPARAITWSGDYAVLADKQGPRDSVQGQMFTNATLVASSTKISVAIGLLVGGRNLREIRVPDVVEQERQSLERMALSLDEIGIRLVPLRETQRMH